MMKTTTRRILIMLTIGALCGLVMSLWNPVNTTLYRLGFMACILGVWLGCFLSSGGLILTLDGRKDYNAWFLQPVSMYRWSVLAE